MRAVDTNILARFYLRDDAIQGRVAADVLSTGDVFVSKTVVLELEWVLRYLADAYKALDRTVPREAKSEALDDIIAWLGELVRQVDSSLLDEWEQLRNPSDEAEQPATVAADAGPPPVTANKRAFRVR